MHINTELPLLETPDETISEWVALAAKKYGAKPHDIHQGQFYDPATPDRLFWLPQTDDGDALRMAIKLRIDIYEALDWYFTEEEFDSAPLLAVRLAILLAAIHATPVWKSGQ